MKLELDREDLKPENTDKSCSLTKFDDFKEDVQTAIVAVGRATFFTDKGGPNESYNVINPPK